MSIVRKEVVVVNTSFVSPGCKINWPKGPRPLLMNHDQRPNACIGEISFFNHPNEPIVTRAAISFHDKIAAELFDVSGFGMAYRVLQQDGNEIKEIEIITASMIPKNRLT